jgi:hypothetical protein
MSLQLGVPPRDCQRVIAPPRRAGLRGDGARGAER